MKSFVASVVAAALLAGSALAQSLTVNTPGPAVVCQPLLITWSGGTPPYFLSILPGNQPSAAALIDFGQQTGTQLTWTVNITAGTSLGLNLRDSTGVLAQSAPFDVQTSSDTSCLTASGSTTTTGSTTTGGSSTTSTTPATTSTTPATTSTTPATSGAATTATTKATTTSGSGTTTAAPTTTSSAASANMANAGIAGAFGIGAALVALVL